MFTGIIEEIGIVKSFKKIDRGALITIEAQKVISDVSIGDSIAVNGACQTVISFSANTFSVEASQETINLTNFNSLKNAQKVNLERAISASSRFGGHIVTGHIDGTAVLIGKSKQGLATTYTFSTNDYISKYIVYKGSISVDGISLTISQMSDNSFSITALPLTIESTNLQYLNIGEIVNIESDILAKYIEKFTTNSSNKSNINLSYLEEHGFI